MISDVKPIIVVSKCLGFEPCRYNSGIDNDAFVQKLRDFVDIVTICPEVGIGLSIPRDPLRLIQQDSQVEFYQPKTGRILTKEIKEYSKKFLQELGEVDGFILKSRSPSCGVKDVKVYINRDKGARSQKGIGIFSDEVKKHFNNIVMEDEGRLTNFKIREHFLTRIYLLANFREMKKENSLASLRRFHQSNSLLFLSYSQKYSKLLDTLAYRDDDKNYDSIIVEYENYLYKLLERAPRYTSNINVLLRSVDQFKDKISEDEMKFIWNTIDKYKNGFIPFSVPLYLVKGYIIRFDLVNLLEQSFFQPYPEELIQVTDSGKLIH